ncbi:hypothetical protein IMZ31_05390 [Pontibacillus sp. ALD_SL1]|uniref:hypothetical protein n=1 Tax=Pontibacillus sp. ALD_SL1 TaxID=2777185 RepID=UPI001A977494|nr:hypothetical protein [Pontibacillus sp. ALD_SL1]QST01005.1 hypothetical protein IMZ31_05390 [Pontibacillus sp. ALD_SL1]
MSHLKNKLYWMLMPPFLIAAMSLIYFLPVESAAFYSIGIVFLFWVVYYRLRKNQTKKANGKEGDHDSYGS